MKPTLSSFRRFLEDMDASLEKTVSGDNPSPEGDTQDYFGSLGDELGIEWKNLVKAIASTPNISAHFNLGKPGHEIKHKLAAWEVVPGSMTQNGASIQLKSQRGDRSYLSGNRLNKGSEDQRVYHLNRQQLMQFLTTGWTPAVQAAQGGGMGADPMGGGMPPGPPMM